MYKRSLTAETNRWFKILLPLMVLGVLAYNGNDLIAEFTALEFQIGMHGVQLVVLMLGLTIVNLSFETLKWTSLYRRISFFHAYHAILLGMKAGFVTPNRVGEFAGRNLLVQKSERKEAGLMTVLGGFIQGSVTLIIGSIALAVYSKNSLFAGLKLDENKIGWAVLGILLLLTACWLLKGRLKAHFNQFKQIFNQVSKEQVMRAYFFAFARYAVFAVQFYLCLSAFGFDADFWTALSGVAVLYLIQSFMPFATFGEIGIREVLAVLIFGAYMPTPLMAAMATFLLWSFNILLPVLVGLIITPIGLKAAPQNA